VIQHGAAGGLLTKSPRVGCLDSHKVNISKREITHGMARISRKRKIKDVVLSDSSFIFPAEHDAVDVHDNMQLDNASDLGDNSTIVPWSDSPPRPARKERTYERQPRRKMRDKTQNETARKQLPKTKRAKTSKKVSASKSPQTRPTIVHKPINTLSQAFQSDMLSKRRITVRLSQNF